MVLYVDIRRITDNNIESLLYIEHPFGVEEGRRGILVEHIPGGQHRSFAFPNGAQRVEQFGNFLPDAIDRLLVFPFGPYGLGSENLVLGNLQLLLFGKNLRRVEQRGIFLVQSNQCIGSYKFCFEVRERADTEILGRIVVGLLIDHQRDKETQLADLNGDRLESTP